MKKINFIPAILGFSFLFYNCASTPAVEEPIVEEVIPEPEAEPEPIIEEEPEVIPEPELEPEPEPEPEVVEEESSVDLVEEEFARSTLDVDVTLEEFTEDKAKILKIIDILDGVMVNRDFPKWLEYVDQSSIEYYSRKANLTRATNKLPKKGLQLKTLEDYFKWVFIPARIGRRVDELRYETSTQVKVVQVQDEKSDIVYYNFQKVNDEWKVFLPPISD